MKTNVGKRSSQELQALRFSSLDIVIPLRPLISEMTEVKETDPYYIEWYVSGRPVAQ